MSAESRVKRWRDNKRQQGLKHVSVWLTPEEERRLKDLAIQWHCAPSQVLQRALAQISRHPPEISSPTDALRIRRLILAELKALGFAMPAIPGKPTVYESAGPTETSPQNTSAKTTPVQTDEPERGHSLVTESAPARKAGRPYSPERQQVMTLLAEHPEGLTAEQLRGHLQPGRPIGDILGGMRRTGAVRTEGQGRDTRYFFVSS